MDLLPKQTILEWGLQNLDEQKQIEMVDRLGLLIYQAVLVRSLDLLSIKQQDELDLLMDQDTTTSEDVLKFLAEKIPTFENLLNEERQKLKDDILVPASVA